MAPRKSGCSLPWYFDRDLPAVVSTILFYLATSSLTKLTNAAASTGAYSFLARLVPDSPPSCIGYALTAGTFPACAPPLQSAALRLLVHAFYSTRQLCLLDFAWSRIDTVYRL